MDGVTWAIVGALIGLAGTIYGIYTNMHKNKRDEANDNRSNGQQLGAVMTELGYIKSSVDDIKRKQDIADSRHVELVTQIASFDQWKKGTDRRIATMETSIQNIENEIHHH